MSQAVPGRISSLVNIHNPSIEVHPVDRGINTGAVMILVAGGGDNTLNVGGACSHSRRRAYGKEINFDPNKTGIMGFSAGAELTSATAVLFDVGGHQLAPGLRRHHLPRPDAVRPKSTSRPPFIATAGSGDRGHAIRAMDYYSAMLTEGVPNFEMHIYGNGRHHASRCATAAA
jgi:endo-1,4-beta-xylanase